MKKFAYHLLYSSIASALAMNALAAENQQAANEQPSETLETIHVSGTSFSQQVGTQKLDEQQIARAPIGNGNITELLRSNPNVQFSNNADSASTAGEIKPNEVSFHGEKFWDNSFIIDGMSNNDNINPASAARTGNARQPAGTNPHDLPEGGTQSLWLDPSLLKNLEVFDSNVSAKYGNFTGGVINAELKDPDLEKHHGKIYYRTTRSAWTDYYTNQEPTPQYIDVQPKFVKQTYGITLNTPITPNFGLLFNYEKTTSDIDYYHLSVRTQEGGLVQNNQRRSNETFLLRGVYLPDNGDLWRATLIYSPHVSRMPKQNTLNGNFENTGGGLQANLSWEKQFEWVKMISYLGYKSTGNEIEHDEADYYRYTTSIPGYLNAMQWGGTGKTYTKKQTYTAKQEFKLNEFDTGPLSHHIEFGWQADISKAKYQRQSTNTQYYYRNASRLTCNGAAQCQDGVQYAYTKSQWNPRSLSANDSDYAAYVQDQIKWGNFDLNFGLRFDYSKFYKNANLAHRLSASYDVFGDQSTRIFAGANRYYARSILAYKMREDISRSERYQRALLNEQPQDWVLRSAVNNAIPTKMTRIKTPYSDEFNLGLSQKILGSNVTLKWVHRNGKDQLARETRIIDGSTYYVLNNEGKTKNDTYTLTIESPKTYKFKYLELDWSISGSINKTKTNNRSYDASSTDDNEKVVYHNQLMNVVDLPPEDFNAPWKVIGTLSTHFPQINLSWDHRFTYTGGKTSRTSAESSITCNGIYTTGRNAAICGDYVGEAKELYDEQTAKHFILDWRFRYKQPTVQDQYLEFTLDVNNVLNKKVQAKTSARPGVLPTWKQGRNFWFGVSYNW